MKLKIAMLILVYFCLFCSVPPPATKRQQISLVVVVFMAFLVGL